MTTTNPNTCPICASAEITKSVIPNTVEYQGVHRVLDLRISMCKVCGVEFADNDDLSKIK